MPFAAELEDNTMKPIVIIPALAAALLLGGATASVAQSSGAYGHGAAAVSPEGAVARGATGADASDRAGRRRGHPDRPVSTAPATSTYGSGAVYTDRTASRAAVRSGGSATGPDAASATTVDAYGETTRDGSSADIYGASSATTGPR